MNLSDVDMVAWRNDIRRGIVKMEDKEAVAMLNEILRLRATVRRMEAKVLRATQTVLPLA